MAGTTDTNSSGTSGQDVKKAKLILDLKNRQNLRRILGLGNKHKLWEYISNTYAGTIPCHRIGSILVFFKERVDE
jgi:hypothetical protein